MTATSIMFISDAKDKATLLLSSSVIIPNTTNEDCCLNNKNSTTSSNEDSAMTSSSSIRSSSKENNTTAINTTIFSTSKTTKISTSHSPSHLPSLSPSPLLLLSSSSCGYHDHYHDPSVTDESLIILKNNIDRRRKKFGGWQRSSGCGGSVETFPFKLHEMLKQPAFEDMVAWQTHGRCFMIHQVDQFVNDVLPRFFNQSKFRSFQRQLNMYGFRRLRRGVDRGGYYHELFLQGREDLCRRLIRSRSGATGAKKGPNGTSTSLSTSSSSSVTSSSSNGSGSDHNSNNHCSKESSSLLSSSCAASIAKASAMEPNFYAMESCGSSSSSSTTTNKGKTRKNIPQLFKSTMMGEQQQQHWQQHQQQQYHHHQQQRQGQHQQLHQHQKQRQQQQKRLQQNFSDVNDSNNAEEDSSLWSANSVENNIVRKNTTLVPLISTKRKRSYCSISESFDEGTKNDSHFEGEGLYLQALSSNFHDVDSARQQQRHLEKGSSRTIAPISNITTSLTEKEGTRPFSPPQSKVEISTTTALIEREERETSSASLSLLVLPQIESCLTLPTTEDNSNEGYGYSSSKLNTFFAKEGNNEIAFLADELPLTDSIFDEEEIILPMANVTPPHSSSPPPVWECSDIMLALPYPFNEIYNTSEVLLLPSS